jgi:hypothetical protein
MSSSPSGPGSAFGPRGGRERRCHYRRSLYSLAYVTLSDGTGGILRDLSDGGACVQTVGSLQSGQLVHLRVELPSPGKAASRTRLTLEGQVAWVADSGHAGIRFGQLAAPVRRQLNEWMFASILTSVAQTSPILNAAGWIESPENLLLSTEARASIAVPPQPAPVASDAPASRSSEEWLLDWILARSSPRRLRILVDALVLVTALLLFLVVDLAVAKSLPTWPVMLALAVGLSVFLVLTYRGLHHWFRVPTAGRWLANLAEHEAERAEDSKPRFR